VGDHAHAGDSARPASLSSETDDDKGSASFHGRIYAFVGIVSETDIATAAGASNAAPQTHQDNNVERMLTLDVMRADVVTVMGTSIRDAASDDRPGHGALPVLNDQRHLVGIVTRRDIIRAI
jgi:CBS domain-containing protein